MGRTAMCCTEEQTFMRKNSVRMFKIAALAAPSLLTGACSESRLQIGDDFGRAMRQDAVAQIADPDARYAGSPPPASNGARAGLAQARYEHNAVIEPRSMTTSNAVVGGSGGGS